MVDVADLRRRADLLGERDAVVTRAAPGVVLAQMAESWKTARAARRCRWVVLSFADEVQSDDPAGMARRGAGNALRELEASDPDSDGWIDPAPGLGSDDAATRRRDRLARLLHENLCDLWAHLNERASVLDGWSSTSHEQWIKPGAPGWDELGTLEHDGMLAWDAWCAEWFSEHSIERVQALGDRLKKGARRRWTDVHQDATKPGENLGLAPEQDGRLWDGWGTWNSASVVVRELAICLWADVLLEVERERANPPALGLPTVELFRRVMQPATQGHGNTVVNMRDGSVLPMVVKGVPAVRPDVVQALTDGLGLLGSMTSHRLFRFLVSSTWAEWLHVTQEAGVVAIDRGRAGTILEIDGGWSGLTRILGGGSARDVARAKAVAGAYHDTKLTWPGGSTCVLPKVVLLPRTKARRSRLVLHVTSELCPTGGTVRVAKVPVVDLPRFVGRSNEHAAQASLQMDVLEQFRKNAGRLRAHGFVTFKPEWWVAAARDAGLPVHMLPDVQDAWADDWLVRVASGSNRWTVRDPVVLEFLREGGARSERAAARGRLPRKGR